MARDQAALRSELERLARATHEDIPEGDPLWLRYSLWRFGLPGSTKISRLLAPLMEADASIVLIDQMRDQDRFTLVVATDGVYHVKRKRLSDGWVVRIPVADIAGVDIEQSSFSSSRFLDLVVGSRSGSDLVNYRVGQFTPTGFDTQDQMAIDELRAVQPRLVAAIAQIR